MKKIFTLISLIGLCLFSNAQTGLYVPSLAAFDTAMLNLLAQYHVPGGQLAITYQGRLVYNRGFGMADTVNHVPVEPDNIFRVASVSKPITAITIMKMIENNLIHLDDKVFGPTGILNDAIYQTILDSRMTDITIRELLNHTAGFSRPISGDPMFDSYHISTVMGVNPPCGPSTVVQYMLQYRMLDYAPGTYYEYSNFGYCILGVVIEKITGQAYEAYVENTILYPLDIHSMHLGYNLLVDQIPHEVNYYDYPTSTFAYSVYDNTTMVPWQYGGYNLEAMDAHGRWVASAENLCRIVSAIDKFPTRPDILTAASIDTMVTPNAVSPYYALGFAVNGANTWYHNGSLAGTTAEIVRTSNEINWAIVLNSRTEVPDTINNAVDALVWNVLPTITSWPAHDLFVGVDEPPVINYASCYPNPANDKLTIHLKNNLTGNYLEIINLQGQIVRKILITKDYQEVSTKDFREGMYFLKMSSGNAMMKEKILIVH